MMASKEDYELLLDEESRKIYRKKPTENPSEEKKLISCLGNFKKNPQNLKKMNFANINLAKPDEKNVLSFKTFYKIILPDNSNTDADEKKEMTVAKDLRNPVCNEKTILSAELSKTERSKQEHVNKQLEIDDAASIEGFIENNFESKPPDLQSLNEEGFIENNFESKPPDLQSLNDSISPSNNPDKKKRDEEEVLDDFKQKFSFLKRRPAASSSKEKQKSYCETEPRKFRKLFISNLFSETSERHIFDYFSIFGKVERCFVSRDPKTQQSRRFGFVEFLDSKAINKVLKKGSHEIHCTDVTVQVPNQDGSEPEEFRKMFVRYLPSRATERDLLQYFSKYGKVIDCNVARDFNSNNSRRFGFVTFSQSDMFYSALADEPHKLKGKDIRVEVYIPYKGPEYFRKIKVSCLNACTTEDELINYFEQYGTIESCIVMRDKITRESRCFAYLIFEKLSSVREIPTTSHVIDKRTVTLELPKRVKLVDEESRKLYLNGLRSGIMEDTLIYHFERFGPIQSCMIVRDKVTRQPEGYGHIIFDDKQSAVLANKEIFHFIDDCEITCFLKANRRRQSWNYPRSVNRDFHGKAYTNNNRRCRNNTSNFNEGDKSTNALQDPFESSTSEIERPNSNHSMRSNTIYTRKKKRFNPLDTLETISE